MRLILASASPRRAELLRAAGFDFLVVAADVDESVRQDEAPATYVRRLAAEKSAAAAASYTDVASGFNRTSEDDVVILAADTAVIVDGKILGKPHDDADAARMLRALGGRRHDVMTGISLRRGAYEVGRVETTAVFFRPLSQEEISWYAASGEGRDKAGGYAIQGRASRFIPRIDGSYSNVVGLPVASVVELLADVGIVG